MQPTLIDSHCHLNIIDLVDFQNDLGSLLRAAEAEGVSHFLSVCVEQEDYPMLVEIATRYPAVSFSVGVHPNAEPEKEWTVSQLVTMAAHPSCIAIGETGLDYYRNTTDDFLDTQRSRFRDHIHASRLAKKPLIIHTRQAAEDTLTIMADEGADEIGGVMHCFSENWDIAKRALDLNFYISFSGILTFKTALILQDVAKKVPIDRILIETDSPFLAPVPFRGKQNHPALVKYVAQALSVLRGDSYAFIAEQTTKNFYDCFQRN